MGLPYIQKEVRKLIDKSQKKLLKYPNDSGLQAFGKYITTSQIRTNIELRRAKQLYQQIQSRIAKENIQQRKRLYEHLNNH